MPIEALFATRPCLRTTCSRGCRAEHGRKLDHKPCNCTDFLSFGTRPCPRSASVEGRRVKMPIEAPFDTRPCLRSICSRGCRAKPGREPDHNPVNGTDFLPFGTRPCPRSASVDGPRAKVPIDVPFATRPCLRTTCSRGRRAEPGREPDHNPGNGTNFLPFATRPCPRSASAEGPRAKVPLEALFATRGCH